MKCFVHIYYTVTLLVLITSASLFGTCCLPGTTSSKCSNADTCSCLTASSSDDCCLPCGGNIVTANCNLPCNNFKKKCSDVMCKSHFSPRSQGLDTARWLVARQGSVTTFKTDDVFGDFSLTAEFTRSFKPERIGKYFTPSGTTTATVCLPTCCSASCCAAKNGDTTSPSCTCASCCSSSNNTPCRPCSKSSSCCTDNCFTLGDDRWFLSDNQLNRVNARAVDFGLNCTGIAGTACLYPRVSNFIVEFNLYAGLTKYLEGLFIEIHAPVVHSWWDPHCVTCRDELCNDSFDTCEMSTDGNNTVGTTNLKKALEGNFTWGDVMNQLNFARICSGRQSKTRLADLRFALGYDVYTNSTYRIGLKFVAAAPTGNVAQATYMFEPIVGNGGHPELGGGLCAHARWDYKNNHSFGVYLDSYVAHMFKTRWQKRTFDLCANGCWSRYLLLKSFTEDGTVYQGLERGPNVFTQKIKVDVDVVADASVMFSWQYKTWEFDIGYNFWGRTRENLTDFCCCIPENKYGIKGITPVCDVDNDNSPDLTTASLSTIAESSGTEVLWDEENQPVFISCNDLNVNSALHPSALSHAVFFHINSAWDPDNTDDLSPFFGIGGKVEFSGRGNRALDQWGVWAKGGIIFQTMSLYEN